MDRQYKIKLDVQKNKTNADMKFYISDHETSDFIIKVTKGGKAIDLSNYQMVISVRKPDQSLDAQYGEIVQDNQYQGYVTLEQRCKNQVGIYTSYIMLFNKEERLILDPITFTVNQDDWVEVNEALIANDDFTILIEALERLNEIESNEESRQLTEELRKEQEAARVSNENQRQAEEEKRKLAENQRQEQETIRQSKESDRQGQEDARKQEEESRVSNENIRKANEVARETNETSRQSIFENKVDEVDEKIVELNTTKDNFVSSINTKVDAAISKIPPKSELIGPQGPQGEQGLKGDNGLTPNITIGNVTTLEPNQQASVTRRGTDTNPIFDFGIPKGEKGEGSTGGGENNGTGLKLITEYVYNENTIINVESLDMSTGIFTAKTELGFVGQKTVTFRMKDTTGNFKNIPYELKNPAQNYSVVTLTPTTFKIKNNSGLIESYNESKVENLDLTSFYIEHSSKRVTLDNINCNNVLIEVIGTRNRVGWTNLSIRTSNRTINTDSSFLAIDGKQWGIVSATFVIRNLKTVGGYYCTVFARGKMNNINSNRDAYSQNDRHSGYYEQIFNSETANIVEAFTLQDVFANGTIVRIFDLGGE